MWSMWSVVGDDAIINAPIYVLYWLLHNNLDDDSNDIVDNIKNNISKYERRNDFLYNEGRKTSKRCILGIDVSFLF